MKAEGLKLSIVTIFKSIALAEKQWELFLSEQCRELGQGPRSNFEIGWGGGGEAPLVPQYWGGTRHFFLLTLYNFRNIGRARAPQPPTPRSLLAVAAASPAKIGFMSMIYLMIISSIPSIRDFIYIIHYLHSNTSLNCRCMFTLHGLHSICKSCDNLRVRGRTSKSALNLFLNDLRTTTLGNVWTSPWYLFEMSDFYKSDFTQFKKRKLVMF